MRKRKWWFAGLAVALLAACVGVWKWSERPPYKFMDGAQLWFVWPGASEPQEDFRTLYVMRSPGIRAVANARAELRDWYLKVGKERGAMFLKDSVLVAITTDPSEIATFPGPPVPPGTTAIVVISRKPTLLDRFRGWLYGLTWRGSKPSSDPTDGL
jgi:hypothetical protein